MCVLCLFFIFVFTPVYLSLGGFFHLLLCSSIYFKQLFFPPICVFMYPNDMVSYTDAEKKYSHVLFVCLCYCIEVLKLLIRISFSYSISCIPCICGIENKALEGHIRVSGKHSNFH